MKNLNINFNTFENFNIILKENENEKNNATQKYSRKHKPIKYVSSH